jgi:ketosteroid isomerase-like protein
MRGGAQHAVRQMIRVRERTSRTLDERVAIRFPALAPPLFRALARLRPTSRLRRALVARSMRAACEAYNRRDLRAVTIGFHADAEYYPYREFVEAGLAEPSYRGPEGYRAYIVDTQDVWGDDVRLFPTEVIDLGDRVVLLADMPMRARGSGIALAETYACVTTLKDGRVIRQQDFLTQAEALESVGLQPPGSG